MSDCVEGGRGDNSRGVGAIKEKSMVGGASACVGSHGLSCSANSC